MERGVGFRREYPCKKKKLTIPQINDMGAIAEEFYEGEDPKCPSVQGCISMNGRFTAL